MAIPERFQAQAQELMEELKSIGAFRRGSVKMFFRTCGKKGCACAAERHPGHPQTKLTLKKAGKTVSRNLPTVESVNVVTEQTRNHDLFVEWCKKWTLLNEQMSDLRLKETLSGHGPERDAQEKKRPRRSSRRSRGRSEGW